VTQNKAITREVFVAPGTVCTGLTNAEGVIGDGLQDALNPRSER